MAAGKTSIKERSSGVGESDATASLAEQRRSLPDQPGVYLFRDGRGRVLYVGKAKSVRKRVASHFSKAQVPSSPGHAEMIAAVEQIECVVVASEAEALLAEQSFIKQYRPRFNIRLRDDKSYPFIAISLDEEYPRVYFTRERHRSGRAYFGPYSNAKRVRGTLEVLAKVFMFRSCTGPEPGRRSGSPCLDYYIKRCEAPCVGYVSHEQYRASIDGVMDFLSGRFRAIERELQERMRHAAAAEEFEQATLERNRLRAVHSLLERRRVANESVGTFDAVAVAVDGREANAQVFQLRDGVLSDRLSFYLANEAERGAAEVGEEFMLQYYGGQSAIPALLVVQRALGGRDALAAALANSRGGAVCAMAAPRGHLSSRRRLRRELCVASQRGRDRWRTRPAERGPGRAARLSRARRDRAVAGQAHRGGVPARAPRAAAARPPHTRAAASAARARRGASFRTGASPHAPRPRDEPLAAGRAAGGWSGPQARVAGSLRLARGGRGGL